MLNFLYPVYIKQFSHSYLIVCVIIMVIEFLIIIIILINKESCR